MTTLVVVGVALYFAFAAGSDEQTPTPTMAGGTTTLRCSACGNTVSRSTDELLAKGQLDPMEGLMVSGEARTCPKCGKDTMVVEQAASR